MTKKLINLLTNALLIFIFVFIFIYSRIVKITVINGINIWLNNLFPTLFPFLLITKLMIYKNLFINLNNTIGKYIERIFNVSKSATCIIILSFFIGFPGSIVHIKDLLDNKQISIEDANKLVAYTCYSNPIFVISIIGETLLNSKSLGIYIYIIHIISGLLIGLLMRNKKSNKICNYEIKEKHNNILMKSINESFEVLINILGIVIFFLIIISIINTILPNNFLFSLIKSTLEITTGIINIAKYKINLRLKSSIIGALLSFNGLSIHYQVKSIINSTKIKYKNYLFARIFHSILCFILIYIFY